MGHKGHWGEYTGNAKWSRDHAHTRVTSKNYDDAVKDDAAHIDYLKRDVLYDDHHGHSDEKMTADEKHISKLAGDMKYDKEHHDSAAKMVSPLNETTCMQLPEGSAERKRCMDKRMKEHKARQRKNKN
tara:strand:+ start:79 stop:462 length:384 start_codon:yes stop_codon:yes gene_type:complete